MNAQVSDCFLMAELLPQLLRILSLRDYNVRVVLLGTIFLGIASGLLGVFLLLRKRALIGDAISHATLPGVAIAFLLTASGGGDKSLLVLLVGAAISGALGGAAVIALRHLAKLREDAALGIVLSVFFGAGVALLTVVQKIPGGNAAGLEAFIYGKAAAMTSEDVWLTGGAALVVAAVVVLLGKELKLLCFDPSLARSQGWPVLTLDSLLIALVVMVTIVGLQAVGLIMMIALLVVPAASARFWTHDLRIMLLISATLGGLSCAVGTVLSAIATNLPSGATIVICGCGLFFLSFCVGTQRGVLWRLTRLWTLRKEQDFQHFLRAAFEVLEANNSIPVAQKNLKSTCPIALASICDQRDWTQWYGRVLVRNMPGLVVDAGAGNVQLTPRGIIRAVSIVREHRLLERYMMVQAEAAVVEADREADYLEHGLQPEHLAELSGTIENDTHAQLLPNPHGLPSEVDGLQNASPERPANQSHADGQLNDQAESITASHPANEIDIHARKESAVEQPAPAPPPTPPPPTDDPTSQ